MSDKKSSEPSARFFRPEHMGTTFTIVAASFTGITYFTGASYYDALARALGLGASVGEPSLQKMVASGFLLMFGLKGMALVAALLAFIFVVYAIAYYVLFEHKGELNIDSLGVELSAHKKHISEFEAEIKKLNDQSEIAEHQVEKLEINRLKIEHDTEFFEKRVEKAKVVTKIARGISMLALGAFTAQLILAGSLQGQAEAERLRTNVAGKCEGCSEFRSAGRRIVGLAALQSSELLVVIHHRGLSTFPLDTPIEIDRMPRQREGVVR